MENNDVTIHGSNFLQVSLLGLVKSVETSSTKISYVIDDMTGCIEAHTYTGTDVS